MTERYEDLSASEQWDLYKQVQWVKTWNKVVADPSYKPVARIRKQPGLPSYQIEKERNIVT